MKGGKVPLHGEPLVVVRTLSARCFTAISVFEILNSLAAVELDPNLPISDLKMMQDQTDEDLIAGV